MSSTLLGLALNATGLTMSQRTLVLVLANSANDSGWGLMPPGHVLEMQTGLAKDEVRELLQELYDPQGLDLLNMFPVKPTDNEGAGEQLVFGLDGLKLLALAAGDNPAPTQPSEDNHG